MSQKLNERKEAEVIEQITVGLDRLEDGMEVETPEVEWFQQMIIVQKEAAKKKFLKEVMIFIGIALIIVSSLLLILYELPVLFFVLQGMAIFLIIGYSTTSVVKQVNEG